MENESLKIIRQKIYFIRGHKVMLDSDLADLYQVSLKRLNEQVKRNHTRFPGDFMFQLSREEHESLRSQIATLKLGRGKHSKYRPLAFTEYGVAMLSSILRSETAIQVNIEIMRAFGRLRQFIEGNSDLSQRLNALEKKYDAQFKVVFDAIRQMMSPVLPGNRRKIGF